MGENMQERLGSIFEVKVKEDRICQAFLTLENKIYSLQQQIKQLKQQQSPCVFQSDRPKMTQYIQKLIFQYTQPIQEKVAQNEQTLMTFEYNHNNLIQNMGEEFTTAHSQLQELETKVRCKLMEEESKGRKELEVHELRINQTSAIMGQLVNEASRRQRDFQMKIDSVWDVVRDIRVSVDSLDHKEGKKLVSSKNQLLPPKQHPEEQNELRRSKYKQKTKLFVPKEEFSILKHTPSQDRSIQYAGMLLKLESLEGKFKDLVKKVQISSEKVLTSKQRIDSEPTLNHIPNSKVECEHARQEKKKCKVQKQSRFGRSSIRCETEEQILQIKEDEEKQRTSVQLKKLNDRVNEMKYKYTLLQENYEIILGKIPRIYQMESQMQQKLDEAEKNRVDVTTVNEIKMRFRKIQSSYQEQEHKYISKQVFQNEVGTVKGQLKELQSVSHKWAKHQQIKQAFQFVQDKIKEIVLVLTNKFQVDRQGAINKIQQIKCLTCDKQIDESNHSNRFSYTSPTFKTQKSRQTRTTCKRFHTDLG